MRTPSMTVVERRIAATFATYALDYLGADPKVRRRMVRAARNLYNEVRISLGLQPGGYMLTPPESQPKTGKSALYTLIMHLLPHKMAGVGTVCAASTGGCRANCLEHSGHGVLDSVKAGRLARTLFLATYPGSAAILITHEILLAQKRIDAPVGVRLNGTSDLRWELIAPDWMNAMISRGYTFYDYTKYAPAMRGTRGVPQYHLTYSAHEDREPSFWADMVGQGHNVALVVRGNVHDMPLWVGLAHRDVMTVNGDATDDRTLDPPGRLVLLSVKGPRLWHDTSGFAFDYDADRNMLTPHVA